MTKPGDNIKMPTHSSIYKTLSSICLASGMILAIIGCGIGTNPQSRIPAPPTNGAISMITQPVALHPENPATTGIGDFLYAGGLVLSAEQTDQFHGLSDLEITDSNLLTAVGDLGVWFEARLVLDSSRRLVGLTHARLTPLTGADGKPLTNKADADAEGLAILPNGDRIVSFERHDRIWLYPATGAKPYPLPMPETPFPPNGGMEALGLDPESGADAYLVGGEVSGDTWTCRLLEPKCIKGPTVDKAEEFGLVAIKRLPNQQTAYLLRAYDPLRGNRISLQIFRSGQAIARMDLARPLTVDNFEGVAAVPRSDGGIRFYLISDDNANPQQRTLLMAFDWVPK
jgi:hypothetical protein